MLLIFKTVQNKLKLKVHLSEVQDIEYSGNYII